MRYEWIVATILECVAGSYQCGAIHPGWYLDLFYCGFYAESILQPSDLQYCINNLYAISGWLAGSLSLKQHANPVDDCLAICGLNFSNAVYYLNKDRKFDNRCDFPDDSVDIFGSPAVYASNTWSNIKTADCLVVMYDAINAFNSCLTGMADIVTSSPSIRCSTSGFVSFMLDYNPWGDMITQVIASVAVGSYAGTIASDNRNSFDSDLSSLTCGTCFDQLYSALLLLSINGDCDDPHSDLCRGVTGMDIALENFAECTGGHYMNTYGCTPGQDNTFDNEYLPYRAYLICATSEQSLASLEACVSAVMNETFVAGADCGQCYLNLASSIDAINTTPCYSSPYDSACTDLFTTQPALGSLGSTMTEFEICTGYTMDLTPVPVSTLCTALEWTDLTYEYRSMVPMYIAAKYAADAMTAGTLIDSDRNLANLKAAINGLGCEPCFNMFVVAAYTVYTADSSIEATCADPYTTECVSALSGPMNAFTFCANQYLNWSATSTTCTSDQFKALLDFGVATSVLAATLSPSVLSLTTSLDAIYTSFDNAGLRAPCWPCFSELARNVFNLDNTDLATCQNITTAACYAIIGNYLNGFQDCSGFALALTPLTTVAPVTTATPSASATTSTNSETKSSTASAGTSTQTDTALTGSATKTCTPVSSISLATLLTTVVIAIQQIYS